MVIRRAAPAAIVVGLLWVAVTSSAGVDARAATVEARIDAPANGAQVEGVVEIRGRATVSGGGQFAFYRVLVGEGALSVSQRPLGPAYDKPVENGLLATWDTSLFPYGEYLLTLRVYADDNSFASASTVVTIKVKPTPTPLAIILPGVTDVPTLAAIAPPALAPVEPPRALDVQLDPFDPSSVQSAPATAPIPIQPIPLDASNPGPFAVDTPTTFNSSQLPGNPAPVYITPIDFDPNH
jgi:hypothetical protein